MRSFKKSIFVALIGMFAALSLTGCVVKNEVESVDNPTTSDYSIEYVSTNDGDFKCLWYLKGAHSGSMSCKEITEAKK